MYSGLLKELKEMFEGAISVLELDNYMNSEGYSYSIFDDTGVFNNGFFCYQNDEIEVTFYFENTTGDLEIPREVMFEVVDIEIEEL